MLDPVLIDADGLPLLRSRQFIAKLSKALTHTNINERKFFELVQQRLLLQPASQTICLK